ncbi:MAG: helix-turn-helix transcriptional regulator, partial [Lentilitoribacter sp.]
KNEFYDWLKRDYGLGYFLGSRLYDEGDTSVFHSIEFSKKHGHPGQAEIDSFTRTSRALGNAWRCASLVAGPVPTGHFKAWVPDHLPWSIFALSSVGKVLDMNSEARALVERRDVVSIWDEILVPSHRSSLVEFKRGIAAAINGHGFDLLLPGGEKSKKYIVKLVPVKTLEFSSPVPLAILVYLWDPMRTRQNIDQSLRILWGLSHAESALVMQLSYGLSLTLAAEALGVSRHTARNQLQNIFAKTNTNRQAELLAHILGIIDHK